jgi:hypothetical protein
MYTAKLMEGELVMAMMMMAGFPVVRFNVAKPLI